MAETFPERLLNWFDQHGRKDLPWQKSRDPYPLWVAEIMLQQTQVSTVIPYFQRFLARFPTMAALASAELDEVLHHWTGLGYYARARNLQRAAQEIMQRHNGCFPQDMQSVCDLPGIGRSTAGAILAFAFGQRHAILDGNVKRVLSRYHAVAGWPGERAVEKHLWALAEAHTPTTRLGDYTQAIMDLGATLCRRSKPQCPTCPLATDCLAYKQGNPQAYPGRALRKSLPVRSTAMLMIHDDRGRVLLRQRPPRGLWGGLWGFPECSLETDPASWCRDNLGLAVSLQSAWPSLRHSFSHFHLDITPIAVQLQNQLTGVLEDTPTVWYNPGSPDERGLAAPVQRLLQQLRKTS